MNLNRREFLARMLAAGAAVSLPVKLAECSDEQIDNTWGKLLEEPWHFDVDAYGTITTSGVNAPDFRNQVFDEVFYVDLTDQCTVESLILHIGECEPLLSHFRTLASEELFEIECRLEDDLAQEEDDEGSPESSDRLSNREREQFERQAKALRNESTGWVAMIRSGGTNCLQRFKDEIRDWLASPIELADWDWVECESGQSCALQFFQDISPKLLDALGVVIVEGEHPGSSYYAAELRKPVETANQAAVLLGLPFQFRS